MKKMMIALALLMSMGILLACNQANPTVNQSTPTPTPTALPTASADAKEQSRLIGRWVCDSLYYDEEIHEPNPDSHISAIFYADGTGTMYIGEDEWSIDWEYDKTESDRILYRGDMSDGSQATMAIYTDTSRSTYNYLFIQVGDSETVVIYAKDE